MKEETFVGMIKMTITRLVLKIICKKKKSVHYVFIAFILTPHIQLFCKTA